MCMCMRICVWLIKRSQAQWSAVVSVVPSLSKELTYNAPIFPVILMRANVALASQGSKCLTDHMHILLK